MQIHRWKSIFAPSFEMIIIAKAFLQTRKMKFKYLLESFFVKQSMASVWFWAIIFTPCVCAFFESTLMLSHTFGILAVRALWEHVTVCFFIPLPLFSRYMEACWLVRTSECMHFHLSDLGYVEMCEIQQRQPKQQTNQIEDIKSQMEKFRKRNATRAHLHRIHPSISVCWYNIKWMMFCVSKSLAFASICFSICGVPDIVCVTRFDDLTVFTCPTPKKQRDEYAQHKKKRKMVEQMRNSEYRYSTATERVMWFYWTVCVCELSYVIVGISAKAKKHRTPMHEILYTMTTERSCCRNLYVSFLFACTGFLQHIGIP